MSLYTHPPDLRQALKGDAPADLSNLSDIAKSDIEVDRNDPRYFDLRFFALPEGSEAWGQARLRQVADIEARRLAQPRVDENRPGRWRRRRRSAGGGRIPYQIIAGAGAPRWRPPLVSEGKTSVNFLERPFSALQLDFPNHIPNRPYCADDFDYGLRIRGKKQALQHRHIQLNGPATFAWMLHDIDQPDAYCAHEDVDLPPPNFIAINPENGHAHSAYLLAEPVARHSMARPHPLRYFAAIERGVSRRLGADRAYPAVTAKNPLHPHWRTEWRRDQPFTLNELD